MKARISLYIAGDGPNGRRACDNIVRLCQADLKDQVELDIVDISATPQVAYDHQIVAVPVLVREYPLPVRKLIGDLSDKEDLLCFLNVSPEVEHVL